MKDIAELARKQYHAWLSLAEVWDTYYDIGTGQERCRACNMGIVNIVDTHGENRQYTGEEITSLIVGHLRNVHRDMEEAIYKREGIS
jgi:hypothetical protein